MGGGLPEWLDPEKPQESVQEGATKTSNERAAAAQKATERVTAVGGSPVRVEPVKSGYDVKAQQLTQDTIDQLAGETIKDSISSAPDIEVCLKNPVTIYSFPSLSAPVVCNAKQGDTIRYHSEDLYQYGYPEWKYIPGANDGKGGFALKNALK